MHKICKKEQQQHLKEKKVVQSLIELQNSKDN